MGNYILKRLLSMVPTIVLVSMIVFFLVRLTPGDPAIAMLGEEATPAAVAALRAEYGWDQPIPVQYAIWLSKVVQGDLGRRVRTNQPVSQAIIERLPTTIELTLFALVISLSIAIPTGIISATRRNSASDLITTTLALIGVSMPSFFLAMLMIFVLSLNLRWLPPMGFTPLAESVTDNLKGMIMPAIALGAGAAAVVARLTRSSLLEVLTQEYIRTARAKGLAERVVITAHALKNAMIPVVTIVGLQVGALLSGAVITETIFVLPGVGKLAVDAIFARDFPMIQGVVLFLSLIFLFSNLLVDVLYAFLDPRIHYA
ncbi:MAG: ABC transporter permease [Chloroflexi bacterium]|nr:ABC transporter permease [Chloroflexota bacterium]